MQYESREPNSGILRMSDLAHLLHVACAHMFERDTFIVDADMAMRFWLPDTVADICHT